MATLLFVNARILTLHGDGAPRRGDAMRDLAIIDNGWVLTRDTLIGDLGSGEPPEGLEPDSVIDLDGRVLMPSFVDCHTHACWAGSRLDEFQRSLEGATYLELLAEGGGIMSTVRSVREASMEGLISNLEERVSTMSAWGTGTMEVKSGYGLTTEDELKMIRAIHNVSQMTTQLITGTFLGAHAIDPDVPDFVERTITETLPAVAEEFPGICCDAYCETGAWSVEDTTRYFEQAIELGCPIRVHADQFNELGMVERALELGALSVDHLEATGPDMVARIGQSETMAVLLPTSGFCLDGRYAPGRALVDAGAAVAVATNFNPGSAPCPSMPMAIVLSCRKLGLTPQEAIVAATYNAACVLGLQNEVGSITVGHRADLVVIDTRDERELAWMVSPPPPPLVIGLGDVIQFLADTGEPGEEES